MTASQSDITPGRLEALTSEYQICRRKLESKCEALLILSKELDQCRSERDQFKLMAEQLRDRYQVVKRQLTGDTPLSIPMYLNETDTKTYSDIQSQGLTRLLFDTKEVNKSLKFEADDLRQKLTDAEGDIKLLREQIARSRVGTTDEGLNTRHFPAHEREDLVRQLEASREEFVQLERDLQQVLDEKEELVTERDAYRTKYERLNTELNYILRGDDKRIVDIDALSMENKFLQERLKQMEEEKTMAIATVTKYKNILEKKKTKGILKLGQSRSGGMVITQKQVHQMIQGKSSIAPTPQALADLQSLCAALLDTINDKNLALSHQRKTNKLLGNRVNELEKKLKTLEVSGLWSISGNINSLEKLKAECQDIKTLVPRQFSQSTETSETPQDLSDLDSELSMSRNNSATASPSHVNHVNKGLSRLDLEELDLLPTKEEVVKGDGANREASTLPVPGAFDEGVGRSDIVNGVHLGTEDISAANTGLSESLDLSDHCKLNESLKLRDENIETCGIENLNNEWKLSMEKCMNLEEVNEKLLKEAIHWDDKDVDDEGEGNLQGLFQPSCMLNEKASIDDYNDEDDEETTEHLKELMSSVTTKLLEHSHSQGNFTPKWPQDKSKALSQSNNNSSCPNDISKKGNCGGGTVVEISASLHSTLQSETEGEVPCNTPLLSQIQKDTSCDDHVTNTDFVCNDGYGVDTLNCDETSVTSCFPNNSFQKKNSKTKSEECAKLLSADTAADKNYDNDDDHESEPQQGFVDC